MRIYNAIMKASLRGKLILLVGPSGSGKHTLTEYIQANFPDIVFPASCTTRDPRPGEGQGKAYYFVSREEFQRRIEAGEFLEWAEYAGNLYGTIKSEIFPALQNGKLVFREVEVEGARNIKKEIAPELLRIIFVDAGSWKNLERRIVDRASISEEELQKRKERYADEVSFQKSADYTIKNLDGGLNGAKRQLWKIITELRNR